MNTKIASATLAMLAVTSFASVAGPNGIDMEKMMQQAEAAQACFEKIDEAQLKALEQKGRKMEQDINALCKAGKTSEATRKAMQYSRQLLSDPSFKQIKTCAKFMDGMMPMLQAFQTFEEGQIGQSSNVCD